MPPSIHRRKKAFLQLIMLTVVLFLLPACTIRLIYDHLDWIIPWYVDDYISLDDFQETLLEKQLKEQLYWHRTSQLPRYAEMLRNLKAAIERGITRSDLDQTHNTLRGYWQDMVRRLSPDIARLLATASDEQIEELLQNLEKRNKAFRERYIDLSKEELRQKKVDRFKRFLRFAMGSLTEEQEKILEEWSYELEEIAQERLVYIKIWQANFRLMLKERKNESAFAVALRDALFFNRSDWPEAFREKAIHNRELTKTTFLKLFESLTDDQRGRLFDRMINLAQDFEEMSQDTD